MSESLRLRIYEVIFEADTREGKLFDIALFAMIIASVIVVMLESIPKIDNANHGILIALEWVFTIFFTIEYILRIWAVKKPWRYITSFYGIIDLLAVLPTYISIVIAGSAPLMIIRILRLLRVFRIFKLASVMRQGNIILLSLRKSQSKIFVFMYFILLMVIIIGSVMYIIEAGVPGSDFDSIPRGVYWAIVTLTTVGYGDIIPHTALGQFLSTIVMIMGYSVIAVPTGIVSAEIINHEKKVNRQACPNCSKEGHDYDAKYCKFCGGDLGDMGDYPVDE